MSWTGGWSGRPTIAHDAVAAGVPAGATSHPPAATGIGPHAGATKGGTLPPGRGTYEVEGAGCTPVDARRHGRDGRHSGAGAGGAVGSRESPTDSLGGGNGAAGRQLEVGLRGTSTWAGGCQRPWLRAPNRRGGRLDVPPAGQIRCHGGRGTRPARSEGAPRNWTRRVVWPGPHRRQCSPRTHPERQSVAPPTVDQRRSSCLPQVPRHQPVVDRAARLAERHESDGGMAGEAPPCRLPRGVWKMGSHSRLMGNTVDTTTGEPAASAAERARRGCPAAERASAEGAGGAASPLQRAQGVPPPACPVWPPARAATALALSLTRLPSSK